MKTLRSLIPAVFMLASVTVVRGADKDIDKLKPQVDTALEAFKKADSGLESKIPAAAGYVVFPKAGKGGFGVGGAHGNGLVYEKGVLVGSAKMSQVTIGLQVGGQSFSELILFETSDALNRFKESKFELGAQVSAVAAAEGSAKDAKYTDGVLVFTRPIKGLMAEATIGGQRFKFDPLDK